MLARHLREISNLALVATVGCASNPSPPAPRTATFDPSEYAAYDQAGDGVISGQAFLRTQGGEVRYGAGRAVHLHPVTSYSREWWNRVVLGGKHLEPGDPRAQAYQRTAIADGEGRFVFADIPAGEYYVVSSVSLESHAGGSTNSTPDSVVGQEVRLQAGMRVDLELDDVYTTVATSWNPVMPPSAVPVGVATRIPPGEAAGTDSPLIGSPQHQTAPAQVTPTAAVRAPEDPVPGAHGSAPTSPSPGAIADSLPSELTTRAVTRDPQVRMRTGDLRRLGIAQSVQEPAVGLLRVEIPGGPSAARSGEYHLAALYSAYRRAVFASPGVVLELFSGGTKFGEYTRDGLLIGAEFTAPR